MTRTGLAAGWIVLALATAMAVLSPDDGPRSPLEWLHFPLLAMVAACLSVPRLRNSGPPRFLPYLGVAWLLGMAVELTLTVDGKGIGGVHPDTLASFVLAQGDYIPLAAATWLVLHWLGAGFHGALWLAAGAAMTEGLVFTGSLAGAIASGSLLGSLLVGGYLVATYWVFLAAPVALLGPRGATSPPSLVLVALGFAVAFATRLFWGLAYAPVVSAWLGLPR